MATSQLSSAASMTLGQSQKAVLGNGLNQEKYLCFTDLTEHVLQKYTVRANLPQTTLTNKVRNKEMRINAWQKYKI